MALLRIHTQEFPLLESLGARFVIVAVYESWRDGEVTNDRSKIPGLQRELRKRFMRRFEQRLH